MRRIIDTEKLKSLPVGEIRKMNGSWMVTHHTNIEARKRELHTYPENVTYSSTKEGPSWPQFNPIPSSDGVELYKWMGTTKLGKTVVFKINCFDKGFDKEALCGKHQATIQITSSSTNEAIYLCHEFRDKNADLSQITPLILDRELLYTYTGDYCLGVSSKKVWAMLHKRNV